MTISKEELERALGDLPEEIDGGYVWRGGMEHPWQPAMYDEKTAREICDAGGSIVIRAFADGSVWAPGHGWVRTAREEVTFAFKVEESDLWKPYNLPEAEPSLRADCEAMPSGGAISSCYAWRFTDGIVYHREGGFRRGEQANKESGAFESYESGEASVVHSDPDITNSEQAIEAATQAALNARKIDKLMHRPLPGQMEAIVADRDEIRSGRGWFGGVFADDAVVRELRAWYAHEEMSG